MLVCVTYNTASENSEYKILLALGIIDNNIYNSFHVLTIFTWQYIWKTYFGCSLEESWKAVITWAPDLGGARENLVLEELESSLRSDPGNNERGIM